MVIKPVSLITSSLAQVYFGEIAELFRQRSDRILSFYQDTTKKLFMFGAPLIFIGAVLSPVLFPILFGSEWKEAGIFAIPLSFMVIAQFVVSSTDRLELYGYNHWELYWNICRTLMVIGGFYLAFLLSFSPVATILLYSILMTIMYAVCYYLNITAIKQILQKKGDPVPD
jgi:O-antigen/teichoic acid export membrane protein